MITYRLVKDRFYLEQILALQLKNHYSSLDAVEQEASGFVTVRHTLKELEVQHAGLGHTVALVDDKVIGYVLTMDVSAKALIPILYPMFDWIEKSEYKGLVLSNAPYVVMGQACIDANYRGKGVFRTLYKQMAANMKEHYNYIITEISKNNIRSLGAHLNIGFEELNRHEEWIMVILPI